MKYIDEIWAYAEAISKGELEINVLENAYRTEVKKRLKIIDAIKNFSMVDLSKKDKILRCGIAIGYCENILLDEPKDYKTKNYLTELEHTAKNLPAEKIMTAEDVAKIIGKNKKTIHLYSRAHDMIEKGFALQVGNKTVFFESAIPFIQGIKKKKTGPKTDEKIIPKFGNEMAIDEFKNMAKSWNLRVLKVQGQPYLVDLSTNETITCKIIAQGKDHFHFIDEKGRYDARSQYHFRAEPLHPYDDFCEDT